ncbi:MAG: 23S rRNA (guanosine(2251)-2'-O)-methyltransferase RlmB [Burkholderiales bacterium]|nr:23S rRNA (guanosine(2251)-2'-O)-methyltransferase RlmB [Nitrosomonadaceae bacterium]
MMKPQMLFGFHAVAARLKARPDTVMEIYVNAAREDRHDARMDRLLALAKQHNTRVMSVDAKRLDGMTGNARHQGVVASVRPFQLPQFVDDVLETIQGPPLLLVLDGLTDPHNLGACLRVADAAGAHAIIAPKDRSVGLTAAVMKVASGAGETVPYITVTNLARSMRELKERDIWLIGADEGGSRTVYDCSLKRPTAWVLGAEGEGLRRLTRETCDEIVSIPMAGAVESLNVSVASGVCLFESVRQRRSVLAETP